MDFPMRRACNTLGPWACPRQAHLVIPPWSELTRFFVGGFVLDLRNYLSEFNFTYQIEMVDKTT